MANIKACLSSESDEWSTPEYIWRFMQHIVGKFKTDAAATSENKICSKWYGKDSPSGEALTSAWLDSPVWCNPPYSEVADFVAKAVRERAKGATIVLLVPARTDTKWWHDYALKADEIIYLRGRLKFNGSKHSAPFPNAILLFKGFKNDV